MSKLLKAYIREAVRTVMAVREAHLARVPNQLVTADSEDGERDEDEVVDEFAAAGGAGNTMGSGNIAGYTGPLGADPDSLGRKKNKPRK
jgi:hypothetical protein